MDSNNHNYKTKRDTMFIKHGTFSSAVVSLFSLAMTSINPTWRGENNYLMSSTAGIDYFHNLIIMWHASMRYLQVLGRNVRNEMVLPSINFL